MARESEYNPKYHPEKLVELMSKGLIDCEIQAVFDISKTTFHRWRKQYPEFDEAYQKGLPKSEASLIINPLKTMIEEKNERGYKALAHLARNKFGHDQTANSSVNHTQINIGQMNLIKSMDDYDRIAEEVKDKLKELDIIDVNLDIDYKPLDNPPENK